MIDCVGLRRQRLIIVLEIIVLEIIVLEIIVLEIIVLETPIRQRIAVLVPRP